LLVSTSAILCSQETVTSVDSIVTYRFISEYDSVQSSIRVIERIDSIHPYEFDWSGIWNADSVKWIPDRKGTRELDKEGNEIFNTWSIWKDAYGWEKSDSIWIDYDASGNITFNDRYKWNVDRQEWNGDRRDEYFRDGDGIDTLSRGSLWDQATNDWQYSSMLRTIYDEDHRVLETFYYNWNDGESVWVLAEWKQSEYIFNVSGDTVTRISYKMNLEDSTRVQDARIDYSYDEQHRLLKEEMYIPDEEATILFFIMEYAYDEAGNQTLYSGLSWNYLPDTVVSGYRSVYAFNSQGGKTLEEALLWDEKTEEWQRYDRTIITYNEKDQITAKDYTHWNIPGDGALKSQDRMEFLYTDMGQDSVKITYAWNYSQLELYLLTKIFYYYGSECYTSYDSICEGAVYEWRGQSLDTAGIYLDEYTSETGTDSSFTLVLSFLPKPAPLQIAGEEQVLNGQTVSYLVPENSEVEYRWSLENGTILSGEQNDTLQVLWETMGTGEVAAWALNEYGCSSDTATLLVLVGPNAVKDHPDSGILLYPVPVKDLLHIQSGPGDLRIEVMELSGRKVASSHGTSIDLSHLPGGVYLVRLLDPEGVLIGTRKIVKR